MSPVSMYYVGGIFNLVFLVLSIAGYYYVARKTGNKLMFWLLFACAWLFSCISYVFLIYGAPSGAWYITLIRILTYLFFLGTIISMFIALAKFRK